MRLRIPSLSAKPAQTEAARSWGNESAPSKVPPHRRSGPAGEGGFFLTVLSRDPRTVVSLPPRWHPTSPGGRFFLTGLPTRARRSFTHGKTGGPFAKSKSEKSHT